MFLSVRVNRPDHGMSTLASGGLQLVADFAFSLSMRSTFREYVANVLPDPHVHATTFTERRDARV
jgi:hypothetical protein